MTNHISITEFKEKFKPKGNRFIKNGKSKHGNHSKAYRSIQGFERTYDSHGEADCAAMLDSLMQVGVILSWVPQQSFLLPGNTRHYVDFIVFYQENRYLLLEFKGHDTASGIRNRKQVEAMYRVEIRLAFSVKEAESIILEEIR